MRQAARSIGIMAVMVMAALAVGSPALAATAEPVHGVVSADVDDFLVESFDAEYQLSRDGDGRSALHTVETIVTVFPDFDQNRGIIRDLPRVYDGHDTDLRVIGVTDERGVARPFTTEPYGDFLSVTIAVPVGSFVQGHQSYVIEYTQRDVTRYFKDTGADEFYWDVNGTDWAQPFGRVTARLTLTDGLAAAFNGQAACYRGYFGSGDACELSTQGRTIIADERDLGPYENVTIAAGFAPGTFAAAPTPFFERVPLLLYGGFASLLAAIVLTLVTLVRGWRGAKTGRAIIAQYEPPEGLSVAGAAELLLVPGKAMTATLLDFAVRRKLRLLHDAPSDIYGVQAIDGTGLLAIEQSVWSQIFPTPTDTVQWFDRRSTRLGDAARAMRGRARSEVRQSGLERATRPRLIGIVVLLFVLALALPVLHAVVIGNEILMTVLLAVGINVLIWLLIGLTVAMGIQHPRTHAGALVHDHLMGLREYIRLAEADRIRMLQSVSGAEVGEDRIVQVYERLLPYAVLFGFEKEWQAELAKYYRESMPDWVGGSSSSFTQSLSFAAFANSVMTSPATRTSSSGSGSGSSFSSSSGGSSGGGSSGGGGGGGGGRGI